jgi:hypothetical protein
MVVLATTNLTLADWAKRTDPDGTTPIIANLLSQTNEILTDCVFREGNLPTGHRVVIQTGLPTVYWRSLNQGIAPSKGTTAQVDEAVGILEARSEVDKDLAMLNGNTAAFRLSEARMFLESMNQEMASTMFYGNPGTVPEEFLGLAPRYSDPAAGNGQNVIDGGGAAGATNTSIWLIVWGDETIFCPFPKGSTAGLMHRDLGEQTVYEAGGVGLRMQALVDWFQWKNGLVVKDWRYAVRVGSIEVADLTALANEQGVLAAGPYTNILHQMTRAIARIPNMNMGRPAFYMNRTVFSSLMRMGLEKSNHAVTVQPALSQFGTPSNMLSFLGVPIRRCDALINTEQDV